MSRSQLLKDALNELIDVAPGVEAAAVVSSDGLPIASVLPSYVEEDRLAAMSAALLTLGERAASGLGKGGLGQVFVEGSNGHVVLMSAGEEAVLVAMTSTAAKVGLILFEMRQTSARVIAALSRDAERAPRTMESPQPVEPPSDAAPARPEERGPGNDPLTTWPASAGDPAREWTTGATAGEARTEQRPPGSESSRWQ
ncbi:MAG: roadblock/LC7 domain-containing protein [Actinomycetota bacterium]|nr:roadblock/LC7 domain-containing protein [Actinomycetota bacterium]